MKAEDGTGGRRPCWRCGLSPTYFIQIAAGNLVTRSDCRQSPGLRRDFSSVVINIPIIFPLFPLKNSLYQLEN